jgi:hypothetical protein
MRKIAGKIALILVLIMLANSFSACTIIYMVATNGGSSNSELDKLILAACIAVDIGAVIYVIINMVSVFKGNNKPQVATADSLSEEEYNSLIEKLDSLPEAELASLVETINSLPEAEKNSLIGKIDSLTEEELVSIARTFNATPQMELVSSIREVNSLNESGFVSLVNVLRHVELGVSPDDRKAYVGLHFAY